MRPLSQGEPLHWQLTQASVRGKSHVDGGLPNQDWIEVRSSSNGRVVAAAVSDGAGSAPRSQIGAKETCEQLAPCMLEIGMLMQSGLPPETLVRERIGRAVEEVRARLATMGPRLDEFHCTVAMCVLTDRGAYLCTVGDTVALLTRFLVPENGQDTKIDFFPDSQTHLLQPDRGEYANETHFITQSDWRAHLRVNFIDVASCDSFVLMTDGAMDVVTIRGKIFRGFLSNLVGKLLTLSAAADRDRTLSEWLSDPRTHQATSDDKTMFVAIRTTQSRLAGRPFLVTDSQQESPQPSIGPASTHRFPPRDSGPRALAAPMVPKRRGQGTLRAVALIAAVPLLFFLTLQPPAPLEKTTPQRPAELTFAPDSKTALLVPAGGSAPLTLRMIPGSSLELLSIEAVPSATLETEGCLRRPRLTSGNPSCTIRVHMWAPDFLKGGEVRVLYRDVRTGENHTLAIPIRAVEDGKE